MITGERNEFKGFLLEAAHVTSAHISLARSAQTAAPDLKEAGGALTLRLEVEIRDADQVGFRTASGLSGVLESDKSRPGNG